MESSANNPPLIAIVGETASGKTALAVELASQVGGEIICADSRTVYKGMDIGTAKPTIEERAEVPHHLLDIVRPDEYFSVAEFKRYATNAMVDIISRGKIPFLVGGTGLYVDAILYDFSFSGKPPAAIREQLQALSIDELQQEHQRRGIPLPRNQKNFRHLVRSLETGGRTVSNRDLRPNTLILGLTIERDELMRKLRARVDAMVKQGLIDEVQRLADQYGWEAPALRAPGYTAFREYLEGTISLSDAKELFIKNDARLAKRQRTWFKRNKSIHWISNRENAVELVTTFLNK